MAFDEERGTERRNLSMIIQCNVYVYNTSTSTADAIDEALMVMFISPGDFDVRETTRIPRSPAST